MNKILSALPTIHSKHSILLNNKLSQVLTTNEIVNDGSYNLVVIGRSKKHKAVTAAVTIADVNQLSPQPRRLSHFDMLVLNTVISLWVNAEKQRCEPIFTESSLLRFMPTSSKRPSETLKTKIAESLRMLTQLHIKLDATSEMLRHRQIDKSETYQLKGYFLELEMVNVHIGNKRYCAYRLLSEPLLYTYARATKQLITVPTEYLQICKVDSKGNIGSGIAMTIERQCIVTYVLRRLMVMKRSYDPEGKSKQQNIILLQNVYDIANATTRDKALDCRQFLELTMRYYQAIGIITTYCIEKQDGVYYRLRVDFT